MSAVVRVHVAGTACAPISPCKLQTPDTSECVVVVQVHVGSTIARNLCPRGPPTHTNTHTHTHTLSACRQLAHACWSERPADRPTAGQFIALVRQLAGKCNMEAAQVRGGGGMSKQAWVYIYHGREGGKVAPFI